MGKLSVGLQRSLRKAVGTGDVLFGEDALPYGSDKWFAVGQPCAAVLPTTTAEVASVLSWANRHGIPVTPRGAGVGYVGGCVPVQGGIVLSLEKMNRIIELSVTDFVAVVQPGVITGDLQKAARKKGLMYPPDPASLQQCSIGGNIATNAGGPRCLKYGVTGNYVLGIEAVLMDGTVLRTGGRTHKNKTGFNLAAIFVGSEGQLGVVTEATLKLLPLPPARGAISAGFTDVRASAAAVQAVFRAGFLPSALEIADAYTLNAARAFRRDSRIPPGDSHLILEVDGQPASVRSELRALAALLRSVGATRLETALDEAGVESIWDIRRSFSESLKATGLRKLNEDIVVPRGRLVDFLHFTARLQKKCGFPIACFGHAGDGNIHTNIMVGDWNDPTIRDRAHRALDELFEQVLAWGGAITGEHGIGVAKLPWWSQAVSSSGRAVHSAIKAALDPKFLLNPGKFVSPLAA
jgi:glycolate oxidase